jgi:hypothetical protein
MYCIPSLSLRSLLPSWIGPFLFIQDDSLSVMKTQEEQSAEGRSTEEAVNPNTALPIHGSIRCSKYISPMFTVYAKRGFIQIPVILLTPSRLDLRGAMIPPLFFRTPVGPPKCCSKDNTSADRYHLVLSMLYILVSKGRITQSGFLEPLTLQIFNSRRNHRIRKIRLNSLDPTIRDQIDSRMT